MTFLSPHTISAWSSSPYALGILALLSFSESAFFIIPPEVMFLPMALLNPSNSILLAIYISLTSITGAIFGYFIGLKGGKPILKRLFSEEKINKVHALYHKYDAGAIAVAALTPIPFKVFTVSAGVFDINFRRFLIAATLARTSRYLLMGILIHIFGNSVRYFIEHQLDKFLLISTLGLIGLFAAYKFVYPQVEKRALHLTLLQKLKTLLPHKH